MEYLNGLLNEIRTCSHCQAHLPLGPRPVLVAEESAQILIIGQAPGLKVHKSGVAWDDASGIRLRQWMGIEHQDFYDGSKVAIVPMGFCYPGTGKSGDLPPRKECSQLWHDRLLNQLNNVQFTLLVGRYAQKYALADQNKSTLTQTVSEWKRYTPKSLPLPHPSPRNNRWLSNNPWFETSVIPYLQKRVKRLVR